VSQYQTAGTNARLKLFVLQGVPASEADNLVAALAAGAVARAQSEVVELDGMAPACRGALFSDGWDEGVTAVSEALVGIADRVGAPGGVRPGDRAAAHIPEHDGAPLRPGGAGRGRPAVQRPQSIEFSGGDVIFCTREAGHYEGDAPRREEPEGWHKCNARTWIDDRPYNYPHTAA
jgi:hypothetical protein